MTEKTFANRQLIAIINSMSDAAGQALQAKKLPVKLLYAIRRSVPQVEEAYQAYHKTLEDICTNYGTTPDKISAADQEQQDALSGEVIALLAETATVQVHTINPDVLDTCGNGVYDALTYKDMDRLWWLVEEE